MFSAVVYNSISGSCKRYAEMISAKLSIPAVDIKNAHVRSGGKVIYVSWIMAGKITGLEKAMSKFNVGAVVQVGMGAVSEKSEAFAREKNAINPEIPVFCKQGAFDINKLPVHFRIIMRMKNKEIAERLNKKGNLNEQEKATLKMAETGKGEPACWCVSDIVEWCKAH